MLTRKQLLKSLALTVPGIAAVSSIPLLAQTTTGSAAFVNSNDYPSIQDALNTGKNVYIPSGTRIAISQTLVISTAGQIVFSDGKGVMIDDESACNIYATSALSGPIIDIRATQVVITGINFLGLGKSVAGVAVRCLRVANKDDMDSTFVNCVFSGFDTCIDFYGRGIRAVDNVFASFDKGIKFQWPDSIEAGPEEPLQPLPFGMRAYYICGNRIHSGRIFVYQSDSSAANAEESLWGMTLNDNMIDVGDGLFWGNAKYSCISGNTICNTNQKAIYFPKCCISNTISNNIISGNDSIASKQPPLGIWFQGEVVNTTIHGNTFSHIYKHAIQFSATKQLCVSIGGNTFSHIGYQSPNTRSVIVFSEKARDFSLVGNTFLPGIDGAINIVKADGVEISGFQIIGNAFDRSKTLIPNTYVDMGHNTILM